MKNILVFTLDGCQHCVDLKKSLTNANVLYNEMEINENQSLWNQVVEQTGYNLLPTVFIGSNDSDEGIVLVPDRDFKSSTELLEYIKKYS